MAVQCKGVGIPSAQGVGEHIPIGVGSSYRVAEVNRPIGVFRHGGVGAHSLVEVGRTVWAAVTAAVSVTFTVGASGAGAAAKSAEEAAAAGPSSTRSIVPVVVVVVIPSSWGVRE